MATNIIKAHRATDPIVGILSLASNLPISFLPSLHAGRWAIVQGDQDSSLDGFYSCDGTVWANRLPASTLSINDTVTALTSTWSSTKIDTTINESINSILDVAPTALDTLNELAAALNDDPNFAATIAASLSNKASLVHTHTPADTTSTNVFLLLANALAETSLYQEMQYTGSSLTRAEYYDSVSKTTLLYAVDYTYLPNLSIDTKVATKYDTVNVVTTISYAYIGTALLSKTYS